MVQNNIFENMIPILAKICFGLMLILNNSNGNVLENLKDSISLDELVDNQYQPLYTINDGSLGITYRGIRIRDNFNVSIRFVDMKYKAQTDREHQIYKQLEALGEYSVVERFGFPKIYYYNECHGKMVTVYSFFEGGNLADRVHKWFIVPKELGPNQLNSLILFRDFVRQSKYMDAHGIHHNNISPRNIMLRGHRSFLINFNFGSQLNEDVRSDNWKYWPRRLHKQNAKKTYLEEWESFLYTMCEIHDIKLGWFFLKSEDLTDAEAFEAAGKMKETTDVTFAKIKTGIKSFSLQKVFFAFANQVFSNKTEKYPDYSFMNDLIMEEIKKLTNPSMAMFTWLNSSEQAKAKAELDRTPLLDICNDIKFKFDDVKYSKQPSKHPGCTSGSVKKGAKTFEAK